MANTYHFLDEHGLETLVYNITKQDSQLKEKLDSEISRAINAEENIDRKLTKEVERAQNVEDLIKDNLNREIDRAVNAEENIDRKLTKEVERAVNREDLIEDTLDQEIERAQNVESDINRRLNVEINRATNKEDLIEDNLNREIDRAINAEENIERNLTKEVERAVNREDLIEDTLDQEIERAINAEENIDRNLVKEVERATNREDLIEANLNRESSRAQNAESDINRRLLSEIDRSTNKENLIETNLSKEISRAQNVEENIERNLTKEVERAVNRESLIEVNLNKEVERAQNVEELLNRNLNREISDRKDADTKLDTDLRNYVDEKTTSVYKYRGSVENYEDLPTSDLVVGDVYNVINPCDVRGKHYDAGTNFAWTGTEWDALGSDLSQYIKRIEAEALVNLEKERAQEAENNLYSDIQNESLERKSEDSQIKLELNKEITRATNKENELSDKISAEHNERLTDVEELKQSDKEILDRLKIEEDRSKSKDDALFKGLEEEVTRAKSAEASLNTDIINVKKSLTWEKGTGRNSAQTIGTGALAQGENSTAQGRNTVAESDYSHVEGYLSKTVIDEKDKDFFGYASHAEGVGTVAKGAASHAEGDGTLSIGMHSHAEGRTTTTGGEASHAEGSNTITNNFAEHAEGVYNLSNMTTSTFGNAGNTLHSIGIGRHTGELEDDRKNAVEVMQNGDTYIIGVGGYNGKNYAEADSVQKVVEDLNSKDSELEKENNLLSEKLEAESLIRQVRDADLDSRVTELENKDYGKVDDVIVDGESVVVNKIATLSTENIVRKSQIGFDIAPLIEGKVPLVNLPPIESSNFVKVETITDLPEIGEVGKIYLVRNENNFYRWDINDLEYKVLGAGGGSQEDIIQLQIEMQEAQNDIGVLNAGLGQEKSDRETAISELSSYTDENLQIKVNYTDVKNDLVSPDTDKPLSAAMGGQLKGEINSLSNEIKRIPQPFKFKGTVESEEELPTDAEIGDVYQIISDDETKNGMMFAWNGDEWLKIAASAVDITSYFSSIAEVNEIINKYN